MTTVGSDFRVLSISTPEGVNFDIPLAGPTTRFFAWLMDALVMYGAVLLLSQGFNKIAFINKDFTLAVFAILAFVVTIGYPIVLEWLWRGQTIGKRIFGLRVIDSSGGRLAFGQIALRNLLRFVDVLPVLYLVGGASVVLSKRSRRLGDMVANTVVIRQRKIILPTIPPSQDTQKFNSLLSQPHLAARLRQTLPPELTRVGMEAVLRRDELSSDARVEVFRALAKQYRVYAKFPDDTLAGISDERFIRNCLEVVLNTGNLRRLNVNNPNR